MRIPCATYRLQFGEDFDFVDAKRVAGYLHELGIDTIYGSPVFESGKSGYDIICPHTVNRNLGGYRGLKNFSLELKKSNMLYLQDIVPNHMAFRQQNQLISDILKKGEKSKYYNFFDIDWNHHSKKLKRKVLAPFLGTTHHKAFQKKEVKVCFGPAGFAVKYHHLSFPLKDQSCLQVLGEDMPLSAGQCSPENLCSIYKKRGRLKNLVDKKIDSINRNSKAYFSLMEKQCFRLSYWKAANEQINYRRFFTINHLICTSVHRKEVFSYLHQGIRKMAKEGIIDGVRVDHIDGLYNPLLYLHNLKKLLGSPFIFVEKILASGEEMPKQWPVWGNTGYDFLNQLNGIFCKTSSRRDFDRIYTKFIGKQSDPALMAYEKKRLIVEKHMQGDMDNLARLLMSDERQKTEEFTPSSLQKAITCLISCFPVYRTYAGHKVSSRDRRYMKFALKSARAREPELEDELDLLEKALFSKKRRKFRMKFQQYSGAVAAKGFEDTLLYNYNRLLSLNEVGSNPADFGHSLSQFYKFCKSRVQYWPYALNASATHDTKRGEDARARLNVLSEIPKLWEKKLLFWHNLNQAKKSLPGCPDQNDEYFLYQAMLSCYAGPLGNFKKRMADYIIKAIREAKVHTAWIRPDEKYEEGFISFFKNIVADSGFMDDFSQFVGRISFWQQFSSLSASLIKITAPGIPDFYQGTEFFDYSLVDPDNRRKVDYQKRAACLEEIKTGINDKRFLKQLFREPCSGKLKLFLIYQALQARSRYSDIFLKGDFKPLVVSGKFKGHIVCFSRTHKGDCMVTVAPRFFSRLAQDCLPLGSRVFGDTRVLLPFKKAENLITGQSTGSFVAGEILADFPVALLLGKAA